MGYPQEFLGGSVVRNSGAFDTAEVLTAAAAVYGSYTAHRPLNVTGMSFHISTAVDDLTNSVVRLTRVDVADVTSAIVTMTIPDGAAAQKVYYANCSPFTIGVGDKLQMEHSTQGDLGGTPAGAGFYGFFGNFEPEVYANETNAIAG